MRYGKLSEFELALQPVVSVPSSPPGTTPVRAARRGPRVVTWMTNVRLQRTLHAREQEGMFAHR